MLQRMYPHGPRCSDHYQQSRATYFRDKGPSSLFLPMPGAAHIASVPAEWHNYPHRVWWQHGSLRNGTDQSCHWITERRSWRLSRALVFQGDPTRSSDRRSTSVNDIPIWQPTATGTSWEKCLLRLRTFILNKEIVNREITKGAIPLVFSQLLKKTIS